MDGEHSSAASEGVMAILKAKMQLMRDELETSRELLIGKEAQLKEEKKKRFDVCIAMINAL